jgi:rhodanese-related sulfurtransferase
LIAAVASCAWDNDVWFVTFWRFLNPTVVIVACINNKEAGLSKKHRSHKTGNRQSQAKKETAKMPLWIWFASLVVVIALAAVIYVVANQGRPAPAMAALPAEINVQTAYEKVQEGAFLLDVRTQEEWNQSHIPGATLIPLNELEARVNEVPKDQEVVVICRSGNRSQEGRDILRRAGFEQVTSIAGGILQWSAAGFPTTP